MSRCGRPTPSWCSRGIGESDKAGGGHQERVKKPVELYEAGFAKRLVPSSGFVFLLVSSPYHMRRAVLVWRKMAGGIDVVPTPVPYSQFYAHGRGASLEQIRGIIHEYASIVAYWWRGWV